MNKNLNYILDTIGDNVCLSEDIMLRVQRDHIDTGKLNGNSLQVFNYFTKKMKNINKNYVFWLSLFLSHNKIIDVRDAISEIGPMLMSIANLKRLKINDMPDYKLNIGGVKNWIHSIENSVTTNLSGLSKQDIERVHHKDGVEVFLMKSFKAIKKIAGNNDETDWCITQEWGWNFYQKDFNTVYIVKNNHVHTTQPQHLTCVVVDPQDNIVEAVLSAQDYTDEAKIKVYLKNIGFQFKSAYSNSYDVKIIDIKTELRNIVSSNRIRLQDNVDIFNNKKRLFELNRDGLIQSLRAIVGGEVIIGFKSVSIKDATIKKGFHASNIKIINSKSDNFSERSVFEASSMFKPLSGEELKNVDIQITDINGGIEAKNIAVIGGKLDKSILTDCPCISLYISNSILHNCRMENGKCDSIAWDGGEWVGGTWVGSRWISGTWISGRWISGEWISGSIMLKDGIFIKSKYDPKQFFSLWKVNFKEDYSRIEEFKKLVA